MKPLRLFLVVVLVLQISLLQIGSQAFASGYICDGGSINYDATTADAICNGTLLDPSQQTITSYSGNYTANPIGSYGSSFSLSGSTDLLAASGFTSAIGFYDTHFSFAGFSDNLLDSNQFTGHIGSYGTKFSFAGFSDNLLNKSLFTGGIGSYGTHFSFAGFNEDLLAPSKFTGAIGYYKDSLFMAVKDPSLSVIGPDPLSIQLAGSTNTPERVINGKTNNAKTTTIQTQSDALDPVDLSTGDFTYDNTLMHIAGIGLPYDLSINYQSQAYYDGPIGFGWDHSYNQKLIENADGSVTYMDGHLGTHTFIPSGDGFEYLDGLNANLQKDQNGEYIMSFKNKSLYHFGANKFIQNISNQNGNVLSFSYDSFNRLTSVVDTVGRTIQYTYYDSNRLKRVTDFSGRYVEFSYYDGATNDGYLYDLKNITIHNGNEAEKNISFTYTKDETEPKLAHNIKTMTDSKGQVYVTNTYDENDRVTSQIYGDGSGSYDYTLADIHEDDTPTQVGSGKVIGTYILKNRATNKRGITTEYTYDRLGNVISREPLTIAEKRTIPENLSGTGNLLKSFVYDNYGQITREISTKENVGIGRTDIWKYDANGNKIEYRHMADPSNPDDFSLDYVKKYEYDLVTNLPKRFIAPNESVTTYTYDNKNNLTKVETTGVKLSSEDGGSTIVSQYEYTPTGLLSKETDPVGNITTYEYTTEGWPSKITKGIKYGILSDNTSNAIATTFTYDIHGNVIGTTDAEGNTKTMTYDAFDHLIESISPEGIRSRSTYDANNNKLSDELVLDDSHSVKTIYGYNLLDKPIIATSDISDTLTGTVSNAYDGNENVIETISPNGTKKQLTYDENDRVISETTVTADNNGRLTTSYAYDTNGNKIKLVDARGHSTDMMYDKLNRLTRTTDALGNYTTFEYDKLGNIIGTNSYSSDGKGVSREETLYNSLKKPLEKRTEFLTASGKVDLSGQNDTVTKYEYDRNGNLIRSIDSKNNVTTLTYDSLGRVVESQDSLGNKLITVYDKRGLVSEKRSIDSIGKTISNFSSYDKDGRQTRSWQVINEQELGTSLVYNALGNVIKKTDANGNITEYTYDYRGKVLSETKTVPGSSVTTLYTYDIAGNLVSLTDADGNVTSYEYDGFGRQISEIYPDGKRITKTYDANGNILTQTDPNGSMVTNTYDALNRLVDRTTSLGQGVVGVTHESYAYDSLGHLITADDGVTRLEFSYDSLGRLTSEKQNGKMVTSNYDALGNIIETMNPDGASIYRKYDTLGRPTRISRQVSSTGSLDTIANYNYVGLSLASREYGNGDSTVYSYDALSRLSGLAIHTPNGSFSGTSVPTTSDGILRNYMYTYDKLGNIITDGQNTYGYDSLSRLTAVTYGNADKNESFTYDPVGNRVEHGLTDSGSTSTTSYTKNILNQYVSTEKVGDATGQNGSYIYDQNGNLIETNGYKFTYDYKNHLIQAIEKSHTGSIDLSGNALNADINNKMSSHWVASDTETGSGADTGSGTESGTGSDTGTGTTGSGSEAGSGGTGSGTTETGSGTETGTDTENGSGSIDTGSEGESGTGTVDSGSGTDTGSGTETGTGGDTGTGTTGSGSEVGSGDTGSGTTETGSGTETGTGTENVFVAEHIVATYTYDILGRRVIKETPDSKTIYIYDGSNAIQEITTESKYGTTSTKNLVYGNSTDDLLWYDTEDSSLPGNLGEEYAFCNARVLPSKDDFSKFGWSQIVDRCTTLQNQQKTLITQQFFIHKDHLGSTIALSDETGAIKEEYKYDVYGKTYSWDTENNKWLTLANSRYNNERLFTGREYEPEIGLYYYRARFYSPDLGRFISRDPIGMKDDIDLYAYVGNNPWNNVDPTGLKGCKKILIIVGIDNDGNVPIVANDGWMHQYISNSDDPEGNYIRPMFDDITLLIGRDTPYDLRVVKNYDEFDKAINESPREKIFYIGHGYTNSITFNAGPQLTVPNAPLDTSRNAPYLTSDQLKNDTQTKEQNSRLSKTEFYLMSCQTGKGDKNNSSIAQQIEEHYGFKGTHAPSDDIYPNLHLNPKQPLGKMFDVNFNSFYK